MSRPPDVSGGERRRREERDVKRCQPTLHRRAYSRRGGGFERRGRSTLHRRSHFRQEGGWREEMNPLSVERGLREDVYIHVAQMGTLPPEGLGEERDEGGERRYPSTLHRRTKENRLLQLLK
jgi:hypothetical protein